MQEIGMGKASSRMVPSSWGNEPGRSLNRPSEADARDRCDERSAEHDATPTLIGRLAPTQEVSRILIDVSQPHKSASSSKSCGTTLEYSSRH